ncbi:hypothetical protein [Ferrovum myxofaciens]|uniref:hypothetical protein n=1 Tax=Ferrovum myxofaciens TaxID=416213 RepID=UPI003EBBCD4E
MNAEGSVYCVRWRSKTGPASFMVTDQEIPCAVLEDGTRVLTQSDFMEAMGMYYSGWIAKNTPQIPLLFLQKSRIFLHKRALFITLTST